jgi:hypothetical protein
MFTTRLSVLTSLSLLCACSANQDSGLYLTADKSTFDGRTEHAVLRVQAFAADGKPGQGVVSFTTPAGQFVGGADAQLADGFATMTYECNPADDTACSGALRLSASWGGMNAGVTMRVTPSTTTTPVLWKVVPTNTLSTLSALAAASDSVTLWAVGSGGAVVKLEQSTWVPRPTPVSTQLTAVALTPGDAPIVVGEHGTLLVWSAGAFSKVETFLPDVTFTAVVATSETEAELATASGLIYHFDGAALTQVFDLHAPIASMAMDQGELWAGGEGALAKRDVNLTWSSQSAPVLARFSVALSSAEGLWLAGARMDAVGGVMLLGPTQWRTVTLSEPITALAVVPGGDERFAVTTSNIYRQIGTGAWLPVTTPSGGAAACSRGAGDLVLVGPAGYSLFRAP